mmetsp:Transcript_99321/g.309492  ORF Transcript_99321/g.309492 Transcript_99321/m.309492 type:complete len:209 (+) Transcript_99321:981-1607(+)
MGHLLVGGVQDAHWLIQVSGVGRAVAVPHIDLVEVAEGADRTVHAVDSLVHPRRGYLLVALRGAERRGQRHVGPRHVAVPRSGAPAAPLQEYQPIVLVLAHAGGKVEGAGGAIEADSAHVRVQALVRHEVAPHEPALCGRAAAPAVARPGLQQQCVVGVPWRAAAFRRAAPTAGRSGRGRRRDRGTQAAGHEGDLAPCHRGLFEEAGR